MTKKPYSTFAMLGLFFMLAVVSVQAQSRGTLEVNIPFEFQIGNKAFPAGEYSVKQLSQSSMLIRSANGQKSAIAQTSRIEQNGASDKTSQEKLVFHQYGSQYFLAQVWMVNGSDGRELNKTKAEREAARAQSVAMGGAKPRKVEVAASSAR